MLDKSIDRIMKEAFPPELPYGFAERVAYTAMNAAGGTVWDLFLRLTPRASIAIGAIATLLLVLGFTGDGPGLVESIAQYDSLSSFFTIP
jgi:hypothetical protein